MEKSDELLMKLHMVDRRLRKLRELNAPKVIVDSDQVRYEKRLADCRAAGISDEDYKEYCQEMDIKMDLFEVSEEFREKCLTSMRFFQDMHKNGLDYPNSKGTTGVCHMPRSQDCSPFCPAYVEATEEQTKNYLHGNDIDTGEPLQRGEEGAV